MAKVQLAPPYKDLIKRLASIRRAKGISQCELSEMIGLDRGHVSKYEAGFKIPQSLFILVCWADALRVEIAVRFRPELAVRKRREPEQLAMPWEQPKPAVIGRQPIYVRAK